MLLDFIYYHKSYLILTMSGRGVNSFLKLGGQVVMRLAAAARRTAASILPKSGRGAIAHPPFIDAPVRWFAF